jgi:hypothetical protein
MFVLNPDELRRRESIPGSPVQASGILKDADQQIVNASEHPLLVVPKDIKPSESETAGWVESCLDRQNGKAKPQ